MYAIRNADKDASTIYRMSLWKKYLKLDKETKVTDFTIFQNLKHTDSNKKEFFEIGD